MWRKMIILKGIIDGVISVSRERYSDEMGHQ
jgi:hypothetical protein